MQAPALGDQGYLEKVMVVGCDIGIQPVTVSPHRQTVRVEHGRRFVARPGFASQL